MPTELDATAGKLKRFCTALWQTVASPASINSPQQFHVNRSAVAHNSTTQLLYQVHKPKLSRPATAALCLPMDHLMSDQDRPQTRSAEKEAAVYGSPSFSQGLEADPSAQGDTGSVDQQQQQQEEAPPPLTDTIRMGLDSMEQRRQQLHVMIDELAQVGLAFLDQQRQQFLMTLDGFKGEIDNLCAGEVAKGQQLSCDTINAQERLNRAQLLVQSLGGAVCQPGGGMMG